MNSHARHRHLDLAPAAAAAASPPAAAAPAAAAHPSAPAALSDTLQAPPLPRPSLPLPTASRASPLRSVGRLPLPPAVPPARPVRQARLRRRCGAGRRHPL